MRMKYVLFLPVGAGTGLILTGERKRQRARNPFREDIQIRRGVAPPPVSHIRSDFIDIMHSPHQPRLGVCNASIDCIHGLVDVIIQLILPYTHPRLQFRQLRLHGFKSVQQYIRLLRALFLQSLLPLCLAGGLASAAASAFTDDPLHLLCRACHAVDEMAPGSKASG